MDNGYAANCFARRKWGPPLSEELEAPGVGYVFRRVGDLVFGVEFSGGKGSKRALLVRFRHWVLHHHFSVGFVRSEGGGSGGNVKREREGMVECVNLDFVESLGGYLFYYP
jgi:hypothetical protein